MIKKYSFADGEIYHGEAMRVAKSGSPLMVFTDWRQLPAVTDAVQCAGWAWRGLVTWQKPIGRPHKGEFRRDAEFIVYARKGGLPADLPDVYLTGVYNIAIDRLNIPSQASLLEVV